MSAPARYRSRIWAFILRVPPNASERDGRSTEDPAQPFQVLQSHRAIAEVRADVGAPTLSEMTSPGGVVHEADHPGDRPFEMGFRPYLILPVRVRARRNRYQSIVYEARDLGAHECH